jgi:quinol monooxygenase YgiN
MGCLRLSLILWPAAMIASLIVAGFVAPSKWPFLTAAFVFGIASFAKVPPMQTRVMKYGKAAPELAATANISAFSIANAHRGSIGGAIVNSSFGASAIRFAAAVPALAPLHPVAGARQRRSSGLISTLSEGSDTMTTISAKSDVMTLINVFTVEPADQRRLVELLTEATEVSVRRVPGFVSASLHRSTDGTKVTMYAQWRSIDDYRAMRQDPAPLPFLQEALTIAKFEPGVYEVVRTFTPDGETK